MFQLNHQRRLPPPSYSGDCPKCGGGDGYLNVHKSHWGICEADRTKWEIGWNLFSGWCYETEEIWNENARKLAGCVTVKPWFRQADFCRRDIPLDLRIRNLLDGQALREAWQLHYKHRMSFWRRRQRPIVDDGLPF